MLSVFIYSQAYCLETELLTKPETRQPASSQDPAVSVHALPAHNAGSTTMPGFQLRSSYLQSQHAYQLCIISQALHSLTYKKKNLNSVPTCIETTAIKVTCAKSAHLFPFCDLSIACDIPLLAFMKLLHSFLLSDSSCSLCHSDLRQLHHHVPMTIHISRLNHSPVQGAT